MQTATAAGDNGDKRCDTPRDWPGHSVDQYMVYRNAERHLKHFSLRRGFTLNNILSRPIVIIFTFFSLLYSLPPLLLAFDVMFLFFFFVFFLLSSGAFVRYLLLWTSKNKSRLHARESLDLYCLKRKEKREKKNEFVADASQSAWCVQCNTATVGPHRLRQLDNCLITINYLYKRVGKMSNT